MIRNVVLICDGIVFTDETKTKQEDGMKKREEGEDENEGKERAKSQQNV